MPLTEIPVPIVKKPVPIVKPFPRQVTWSQLAEMRHLSGHTANDERLMFYRRVKRYICYDTLLGHSRLMFSIGEGIQRSTRV